MNTQTQTLTQDYLKSILHYDLETGLFTWLVSKARSKYHGEFANHG